jgi:hypothetical protein
LWAAVCPVSGSGLSPACHQSFCLSSLCLLKVHVEISSLPLPSSLVCLQHPTSSAVCSFSISCLFNFFWWGGGGHSAQGAMLVYLRGGCGNTTCCLFAHQLVCCASPKQVWSQHLAAQEPSCFLSVMWLGETLYRLGVQGVKVLILLGAFFLPSKILLQYSSKILDLQSSCCLILYSSHHLGSLCSAFLAHFL